MSASQRPRSYSNGTHLGSKASSDVMKSKAEDTRRLAPTSTNNTTTQKQNPNRYKTELCRPFQEYGHCRYGDKCQFAHGQSDLRTPIRHPKYKTELCRTYHSQGYCPYGARCHFIHSAVEARPPPPLTRAPGGSGSLNYLTLVKPPLSPSQDSGISSPEGTPSFFFGNKAFEYPTSDSSSDDQDVEGTDALWKSNTELFVGEWDNVSTDSFSPMKPFAVDPVDDITEKFSTTSLDDDAYSNSRTRLPVFNQLNSFSDTALDMASNW